MDFTSESHQASERVTWERFLSRCDHVDPETMKRAARWSDAVRVPTWSMRRALLRGERLPSVWRLVRTLDVIEGFVDDRMFASWIQSGALGELTTLRLFGGGMSSESFLTAIETLESLRVLEISGLSWEPLARSLRPGARSPSLVRWAAHGCRGDLVASFLNHAASHGVSELVVSGGDGRWWEGGVLRSLETIALLGAGGDASDMASFAKALPASLVGLAVQTGNKGRDLAPLLARELPALRGLDLSRNGLADASLVPAPLIRAPSLTRLSLAHNPVRGRVVRALGEQLASLEVLILAGTHVGDISLAAVPDRAPVAHLDVADTECTADGVCTVLRSWGSTLAELSVGKLGFDAAAVARLGTEVRLPNLEVLNLDRCPIGPPGLVHLLAQAELPELRTLVVNGSALTGCNFETPPRTQKLEVLRLERSRFSESGGHNLFSSAGSGSLCSLQLGTNHLDSRSAGTLAELASSGALSHLSLDESVMLGADALAAIVRAGADGIVDLKIGQSFATANPLVDVLARAPLRRLRRLDLMGVILNASSLELILNNPAFLELEWLRVQVDEPDTAARITSSPILAHLHSLTVHGGLTEHEAMISESAENSPWLEVMVVPYY
jgi:hypothetical protein